MKFISITDGRIARFDGKISPNIGGIYTDNFSSCNIIILYSNSEDIKLSMIHADKSINPADIEKEIKWAGADCKKYVYRRLNDGSSLERKKASLGDFIEQFNEKDVPEKCYGISINVQGEITLHDDIREFPCLITHPSEMLFSAKYKLNLLLLGCETDVKSLSYQKLIFDGRTWLEPTDHDVEFLPLADKMYRLITPIEDEDICQVENSIIYYAKNNFGPFELIYFTCYIDSVHIFSVYSKQLYLEGNYDQMLSDKINYLIVNSDRLSPKEIALLNDIKVMKASEILNFVKKTPDKSTAEMLYNLLGTIMLMAFHSLESIQLPVESYQSKVRDKRSVEALVISRVQSAKKEDRLQDGATQQKQFLG